MWEHGHDGTWKQAGCHCKKGIHICNIGLGTHQGGAPVWLSGLSAHHFHDPTKAQVSTDNDVPSFFLSAADGGKYSGRLGRYVLRYSLLDSGACTSYPPAACIKA